MEVVCDGAKRYVYAPECVVFVMTIMREPCNQGSRDKCYRNHLQAFLSCCNISRTPHSLYACA